MIVSAPLTNRAYGFPQGRPRRVRPVALACIHVTGNRRTASDPDVARAARAERAYANRTGSRGPSAHDYDARNGVALRAIDPIRYAAWSNGDVADPDTRNTGIRRVLAFRSKGYNVNEAYWLETEELGYNPGYAITSAQRDSLAQRIADLSRRTGLAISTDTVHGHWQINGVDRRNCPVPYPLRYAFLNDIIARARGYLLPPATHRLRIRSRTELHNGRGVVIGALASGTFGVIKARIGTRTYWRIVTVGAASGPKWTNTYIHATNPHPTYTLTEI